MHLCEIPSVPHSLNAMKKGKNMKLSELNKEDLNKVCYGQAITAKTILCQFIFGFIAFLVLLFNLYKTAEQILPNSGSGLATSILVFTFWVVLTTASVMKYEFNKIIEEIIDDKEKEEFFQKEIKNKK